jgi:hypothetical protein
MSQLVTKANYYISRAIAESTRKAHTVALKSYASAFSAHGASAPFPATQTSLCAWMTHSADREVQPLKPSTLRTYLSYISSAHQEWGYADLLADKPLVFRCWKGIRKTKGEKKMLRRPITTDILQRIRTKLFSDTFEFKMFFSAASLATYGLLRMGEFTVNKQQTNPFRLLSLSQVKLFDARHNPIPVSSFSLFSSVTYLSLTLLVSKTDPFRESVTVHVGHRVPVQAMLDYLRVHPAVPSENFSAPLFVCEPTQLPLQPLDRETMITSTRRVLFLLNLPSDEYHGHSFRKGGATSLATAGVADSVIQMLGRWRSDCYKLYIATALDTLLAASRKMG